MNTKLLLAAVFLVSSGMVHAATAPAPSNLREGLQRVGSDTMQRGADVAERAARSLRRTGQGVADQVNRDGADAAGRMANALGNALERSANRLAAALEENAPVVVDRAVAGAERLAGDAAHASRVSRRLAGYRQFGDVLLLRCRELS